MTERIITDSNGRKHITNEPQLHPPQRTWVGLFDEEIWQIATGCTIGGDLHADKFARAIESKLKEVNT